jgi:activator of HSP90 ATPase
VIGEVNSQNEEEGMMNTMSRTTAAFTAVFFVQLLVLAQGTMRPGMEPSGMSDSAKTNSIHQEIDFTASPQRLYEALLDSAQFRMFSGRPAQIDRTVGGAFILFGGPIVGRIVELVPNQRIVEAWRVADWPAGVYSIAKFELKPQGSGTRIVFDHTGFPEDQHDHLAAGWKANYWNLLAKYLH